MSFWKSPFSFNSMLFIFGGYHHMRTTLPSPVPFLMLLRPVETYMSKQYHFSCLWRISFNLSCKASLLATHSLKICLFKKVFISPRLMKDNLTGYRILSWCLFVSVFPPPQHVKYFMPFSFCPHGFQREVLCNSFLALLEVSFVFVFPLWLLSRFLFVFHFL